MTRNRQTFGLSFDPRALTDLLQAPGDIRDLTLSYLEDIVNARAFGERLDGDLEGYRKVAMDRKDWRIIYGFRPAPPDSPHRQEIHVIAVRPRAGNDVYDTVGHRLGLARRPLSARTHAARSRSPQLTRPGPVPRPGSPPHALPAPRPATPAAPRPRTR
ncbi:hypothetical protein AA958_19010 [Streptomyces sp. CNQ-509]|uniref:hypothetical protein n=1 Tax=Streptomyces sp. CNQ-509 TaxID=444103 RepID=UPI00062DEA13|nr:hypothetical protein [Streptomyces sp. CNQ-509]AKH83937.1 hypothetical protein AA958_19010 [Streptomyces sp. CNQ-509]